MEKNPAFHYVSESVGLLAAFLLPQYTRAGFKWQCDSTTQPMNF